MRAIILKDFGGVKNLIKAELPIPQISDKEVLVKVKAIGVNPVDIKTRTGRAVAGMLKGQDPIILGWDISGVIIKKGRSVTSFETGDEVFGMVNFPGHGKAYAEYVAAPAGHLAKKPARISHIEAAAASLAAMTAWQIFKEKIHLKSGDKILIHAAAGGVGHYAVQMARYFGAHVVATSSVENKKFILNLGACEHIDYKGYRFEDVVENIDFVLDTVGGDYIERSFKVLKPGGTIISIPSETYANIDEKARAKGLTGSPFTVRSDGQSIREIADLLQGGVIKSFVSKTFSFNEIHSAHLQVETRKTKGKVVVTT